MRKLLSLILTSVVICGCAAGPRAARKSMVKAHSARADPQLARELNAKAVHLIRQQKYDEAEAVLKRSLAADLTYGPAHNNLGKVYFHQSKFYLAAWQFQYAVKLMPNHFEPRNNLGLLFEEVGKLDRAVECYTEALSSEPGNPLLIGNLARARVRRGDTGNEVRSLLDTLVAHDARPEWLAWAKAQLILMHDRPE